MGIVEAAIAGTVALLGSYMAWKSNKNANETNKELAKQGQEFEQQMWQQQNAYNSPTSIMARYSEAGLNPNLIYGSGSISTGSATTQPRAHVATVASELRDINLNGALGILNQYQDYRNKKAVEDNTRAMTDLNIYKAVTEQAKPDLLRYQATLAHNKGWQEAIRTNILESQASYAEQYNKLINERLIRGNKLLEQQYPLNVQKSQLNEELIKAQALKNIYQGYENEMQSTLKQYNLTNQDSIWARLMARIVEQFK